MRQKAYSCSEAERVQPIAENRAAHDATCVERSRNINRLLHRRSPDPNEFWQEAKDYVELNQGVLVIDDTMLDKWYAKKMELVSRQWSGKHKRVVQGINLTTLLWSDGDKHIPLDYRLYEKEVDGATKMTTFEPCCLMPMPEAFMPSV